MSMGESMLSGALAALVAFERDRVHYCVLPPEGEPGFEVASGWRPVLISAPHGTAHWRKGRWKQEEEYTSALARWLADQTGAYAIYTTYAQRPDPHADRDAGAYKAALADLLAVHRIGLVLDLHGVRGDRDFALALGTINGASCPAHEQLITERLLAQGFHFAVTAPSLDRLVLNHPRYAGGVQRQTVTRFAWEVCGVQAAQLEINAWLRVAQRLERATSYPDEPDFRCEPARTGRLLAGLVSVIEAIE